MSNLNTREQKLKLVFAAHPNAKKIFMTSDDRAFFEEHVADGHAQGLKDKEVKSYSKPLVEAFFKVKESKEDAGAGEGAGADTGAGEDSGADDGAGAGDDTGAGDGADEKSPEEIRAALVAKYEEVFGKKPFPANMKLETLQAKIAEAEAK